MKTLLDMVKYSLWRQFFSLWGVQAGTGPYCKFGTPNISENTRARKLKLKIQLDIIKYSR